jgi:hypothetical protein
MDKKIGVVGWGYFYVIRVGRCFLTNGRTDVQQGRAEQGRESRGLYTAAGVGRSGMSYVAQLRERQRESGVLCV